MMSPSQAGNALRAALEADGRTDLERLLDEDAAPQLDADVEPACWQRALLGPAREFLRRPGKGLRAELMRACWALGQGTPGGMPAELPQVIELLHAGSLIVDDIEDGSDERRGAAALHHLVGMPVALNTGNWMYFYALDLLQRALPEATAAPLTALAIRTMVRCHEGQALDIATRVHEVAQCDVPAVVRATTDLKTGALMELGARIGAAAAGATGERLAAIGALGRALGTGLQMLDDLGSVTSARRADKGAEDLRHARVTWPWAWAASHLDEIHYSDLRAHSREVAAGADPRSLAARLREIAGGRGREAVRRHLCAATANLAGCIGDHPALAAIDAEIERLEQSYD